MHLFPFSSRAGAGGLRTDVPSVTKTPCAQGAFRGPKTAKYSTSRYLSSTLYSSHSSCVQRCIDLLPPLPRHMVRYSPTTTTAMSTLQHVFCTWYCYCVGTRVFWPSVARMSVVYRYLGILYGSVRAGTATMYWKSTRYYLCMCNNARHSAVETNTSNNPGGAGASRY